MNFPLGRRFLPETLFLVSSFTLQRFEGKSIAFVLSYTNPFPKPVILQSFSILSSGKWKTIDKLFDLWFIGVDSKTGGEEGMFGRSFT